MNDFTVITKEGGDPLGESLQCSKCGDIIERGIVSASRHAWKCWKVTYELDMSAEGCRKAWDNIVAYLNNKESKEIKIHKFDPIELKPLKNPK